MKIGIFKTIAVDDYYPDGLELLKAAEIDCTDLIKNLLRSGINVNNQDKCEGNALILAT